MKGFIGTLCFWVSGESSIFFYRKSSEFYHSHEEKMIYHFVGRWLLPKLPIGLRMFFKPLELRPHWFVIIWTSPKLGPRVWCPSLLLLLLTFPREHFSAFALWVHLKPSWGKHQRVPNPGGALFSHLFLVNVETRALLKGNLINMLLSNLHLTPQNILM